MAEMTEQTYDIQELVDRSGIQRRNIYFYVQQAILPPPVGAGLASRYTEEHLLRLQLIPHLRRLGLRLDQIREKLAGMSQEEMKSVLAEQASQLAAAVPASALRAGVEPQSCLRFDLPGGLVLLAPATQTSEQKRLVGRILELMDEFLSTHPGA
jgi:DNA-binding transcriptional MerR regulator